jgi:LEA14-like dessication related protein
MRTRSFVLSASLFAILAGCAALHLERPRVALVDVGLRDVSLFESSLAVTLRVDNPNGFRLPIQRGSYTVFLAGELVGSGATGGPLEVPAHGTRTEEIVLRLDNRLLLSRLRDVLHGRSVGYRLEADHWVGGGLRSRAIRSVAEGELDLSSAYRSR